jgi:hypothetical protein
MIVLNAEDENDSSDSSDDGTITFGDISDPPPMNDDSRDISKDKYEDIIEAKNSEIVEKQANLMYDDMNQKQTRQMRHCHDYCQKKMGFEDVFGMFRCEMSRGRVTQIDRDD